MTFTADSRIADRVVPSPASEVGPRPNGVKDIRAIVIHHAEGGGTVEWLTRPDGNSSHYVVRYSGQIVQMVRESNWAGSMNPKLTRTNDDAPFTYLGEVVSYGATALKRALGAGAADPNRYVIAIEVEGFAKDGPNAVQRKALRELVDEIRSRRGPLPCIGHRDQQSYKACPGKRIPWADYGGHAVRPTAPVPIEGEPMILSFAVLYDLAVGATIHHTVGGPAKGTTSTPHVVEGIGTPFKADPTPADPYDDEWRAIRWHTEAGDGKASEKIVYTPARFCMNGRPPPPPVAVPDPAVIEAAVDAEYQRVTRGSSIKFPPAP